MKVHRIAMLARVAFVTCLLSLSVSTAVAQQKEMTVEELEKFIEEKKKALEQVVENRELTKAKADQVREALAKQEEQQRALEAEFEALCQEREAVEAGSFDKCMAEQTGG